MSWIGYRTGGIEEYVEVNEPTAAETVETVKVYVENKIIDLSRIENAYVSFDPAERVEDPKPQIECYGDEHVEIYSCITPDDYIDTVAVAECLKLLGFKLSKEEQEGDFRISLCGRVNEKYSR